MADALYLVRLAPGRCGQTLVNRSNACIVVADDDAANEGAAEEANAREAAAADYGSTSEIWADADVTPLTVAGVTAPIRLATT